MITLLLGAISQIEKKNNVLSDFCLVSKIIQEICFSKSGTNSPDSLFLFGCRGMGSISPPHQTTNSRTCAHININ